MEPFIGAAKVYSLIKEQAISNKRNVYFSSLINDTSVNYYNFFKKMAILLLFNFRRASCFLKIKTRSHL